MLYLSSEQLSQLHRHGRDCYPEECCGLMLGFHKQNSVQVEELWSTDNSWSPDFLNSDYQLNLETRPDASRRNRFVIAPVDLLRAQKYARKKQLEIIGVYHSHPDHPAVPSEYDRKIAWEQYSYLIMSVSTKEVTVTRSWKLNGDRQFLEEEICLREVKQP